MASIGDILDDLSTSTPLLAGATWTSKPVQPGTYNSLTVNFKSDSGGNLVVMWSADGTHYDFVYTSVLPPSTMTTGTQQNIVVTNKWIKLSFTNTGLDQTYMRLKTYGVVTNNSTQSILVSSIAGKLNSILVANLGYNYDGLQTYQTSPLKGYSFKPSRVGSISNLLMNDNSSYPYGTSAANPAFLGDLPAGIALYEAVGAVAGVAAPGDFISLTENVYSGIMAGEFLECQFRCKFYARTSTGNTESYCGLGRQSTLSNAALTVVEGIGMGYDDQIYIIYSIETVEVRIAQNAFNLDKFDGTGDALLDLDPLEFNTYRILYSQYGAVIFILDLDGVFKPCHIIRNIDVFRAMPMLLYNKSITGGTGSSVAMSVMNWSCSTHHHDWYKSGNSYNLQRVLSATAALQFDQAFRFSNVWTNYFGQTSEVFPRVKLGKLRLSSLMLPAAGAYVRFQLSTVSRYTPTAFGGIYGTTFQQDNTLGTPFGEVIIGDYYCAAGREAYVDLNLVLECNQVLLIRYVATGVHEVVYNIDCIETF
jgi:hypothetical protein